MLFLQFLATIKMEKVGNMPKLLMKISSIPSARFIYNMAG